MFTKGFSPVACRQFVGRHAGSLICMLTWTFLPTIVKLRSASPDALMREPGAETTPITIRRLGASVQVSSLWRRVRSGLAVICSVDGVYTKKLVNGVQVQFQWSEIVVSSAWSGFCFPAFMVVSVQSRSGAAASIPPLCHDSIAQGSPLAWRGQRIHGVRQSKRWVRYATLPTYDAAIRKYDDAAREVANHAVLLCMPGCVMVQSPATIAASSATTSGSSVIETASRLSRSTTVNDSSPTIPEESARNSSCVS